MIDSHCHLADEAFEPDLDAVVARARDAGLVEALCIRAAGDEDEARRAARVRDLWPAVRFAVGVHPHAAARIDGGLQKVVPLVAAALDADPLARAVGEIGLDYHYNFAPPSVQRDVFRVQLALARERRLPVVIHTREADDDTLAILREEGAGETGGIFHCFTGNDRLATQAVELGFHVSFAGILTFPRAEAIRAAARSVPADRLLVETDSPYLAPVPHRGRRNEPAWVLRTLDVLAHVRGEPVHALAGRLVATYRDLIAP